MSRAFVQHLCISACILYVIATGFNFFLKLRNTLDFSYMAIVILGAYTSVLINMHRGFGMMASIGLAIVMTMPLTMIVVYLSNRLTNLYFTVGTLTMYMMTYQIALNWESLTNGSFGLSGMQRVLIGTITVTSMQSFLILVVVVTVIIMGALRYFQQTTLYRILQGWGEHEHAVQALGLPITPYKLIMIVLTTVCASVGGGLYAYYYQYIDPSSFWLSMLNMVLIICFVSYKSNQGRTWLIAFFFTLFYEYLRFVKVVDPTQLGYLRECVFGLCIVILSFVILRRSSFGRTV